MEFDLSGGSDNFGGNDSSEEDEMDLDMDYQPPGFAARKSVQKKETAGGPRKIKSLPIRAKAAKGTSASAQTRTAEETLEEIYRDIDKLRLEAGRWWHTFNYPNPFIGNDGFHSWQQKDKDRYLEADGDNSLKREFLVVAMHSPAFRKALKTLSDPDWVTLLERVRNNRESLRMFAIMSHIPYSRNYDAANMPALIEPMQAHPFVATKFPSGITDPHQVFLGDNGDPQIAKINGNTVQTIQESAYDPKDFAARQRHSDWPALWPYPHDPSYPGRSVKPPPKFWPTCINCLKPAIGGRPALVTPDDKKCTCTLEDVLNSPRPLLEIRQFPPIPGDKAHINRGIRALCKIEKDRVLGEYAGRFMPYQYPDEQEKKNKRDLYAFTFLGPPDLGHDGRERQSDEQIACVTSQLTGNWTRFVNQKTAKKVGNNCEFVQEIVAGRNRLLLRARKNINFGEELTASYGDPGKDSYFGVGEEEKHDKKRQKVKK